MSERAREPIFEEAQEEPDPEPETSSSGAAKPPGRIGSGLWDDEDGGERKPPRPGSGGLGGGRMDLTPQQYAAPIEDLNLSMRGYNCLRRSGLITVGQVLEKTEDELLSLRNFGRQAYEDLQEKLADWKSSQGIN